MARPRPHSATGFGRSYPETQYYRNIQRQLQYPHLCSRDFTGLHTWRPALFIHAAICTIVLYFGPYANETAQGEARGGGDGRATDSPRFPVGRTGARNTHVSIIPERTATHHMIGYFLRLCFISGFLVRVGPQTGCVPRALDDGIETTALEYSTAFSVLGPRSTTTVFHQQPRSTLAAANITLIRPRCGTDNHD